MMAEVFNDFFAEEHFPSREITGYGSFARSARYDSIDFRMSTMMNVYKVMPSFAESCGENDRKQVEEERNTCLTRLLEQGALRPSDVFSLRPSDVFLRSGKDVFLAKLVPGTLSYYQRVRENAILFREYRSSCNHSEQQRIIHEIVESVWLNQGRFLAIDKKSNVVISLDDKKLPQMVVQDLMAQESAFSALWALQRSQGCEMTNPPYKQIPSLDTPLSHGRNGDTKKKVRKEINKAHQQKKNIVRKRSHRLIGSFVNIPLNETTPRNRFAENSGSKDQQKGHFHRREQRSPCRLRNRKSHNIKRSHGVLY